MKIVAGLVLSVAIALIVIGAFYTIFGSANCEAMANITATDLKNSINKVANPAFPSYAGNDVPTNPIYYEESLIRMCQQHTQWSYALSFWGGWPQYQIYYEEFPEGFFGGGSWLWDEAYPWSGGAGSTLVFWGALRTGSFAFKGIKYAATGKLAIATKLARAGLYTRRARIMRFFSRNTDDFISMLASDPAYRGAFATTRNARIISNVLAKQDGLLGSEGLGASELIVRNADGYVDVVKGGKHAGKYVLNDQPVTVTISKSVKTTDEFGNVVWKPFDFEVWTLKDASGKVKNLATTYEKSLSQLAEEGYRPETFIPSQGMKAYIDDLQKIDKDQAKRLLSIYAFPEGDDLGPLQSLRLYGIENTKFYEYVYDPTKGRINGIFNRINTLGYKVDQTVLDPNSLKLLALSVEEAAITDPNVLDRLIKPSLTNRLKLGFGIGDADELTVKMIKDYTSELKDNLGGGGFLHKSSVFNIDRMAIGELKNNPNILPDELITKIKGMDTYTEYFAPGMAKELSDNEFNQIVSNIYEHADTYLSVGDEPMFEVMSNADYFKRIANDIGSDNPVVKKRAQEELGIIIGFLEKNTDTIPASIPVKFGHLEVKKIVYLDGTAFINPNSWVMKQFMGEEMTEYCEGNSMCVYSHASQTEAPFYMSEEANEYFIRVWRPIPPQAYLSIQGNLMHPAEHPRFYLVSPCFGKAKIWKTQDYKGQKTIFIDIEKCDVDLDGDGNPGTSNYCYADEELIGIYADIWLASDTLTLLEAFASMGTSTLLKSVISFADPVTFGQAIAEAAVSWPGYPWTDLTYEKMSGASAACVGGSLKEDLERTRGVWEEEV